MSGRGAYYKQKYGGGGRGGRGAGDSNGRGGGRGGGGYGGRHASGGYGERVGDKAGPNDPDYYHKPSQQSSGKIRSVSDLTNTLRQIDGRQYPSYKDLSGSWDFDGRFTLHVDYVQGDAYAAPSRMRVQVIHEVSKIPAELWASKAREIACRDFFARRFAEVVASAGGDMRQQVGSGSGGWHAAKGGDMSVDAPGQTVLERTAVIVNGDYIEARFTLALPAQGRTVMGKLAYTSLVEMLPKYVASALLYQAVDQNALARHIQCMEDSTFLRQQLASMNLVAFVANGSILPRASGASDKPMEASGSANLVPFTAPSSMEVQVQLPNRGIVTGMGITRGVTLITGGGFHGKSTLLKALERGVYDHIPGDGREIVVTDSSAVKIRAEDGRQVNCVDISTFIGDLPYGKRTDRFASSDASGSTSQAANIQESLEAGSSVLLFDEDTCATNFMIRDQRMKMLVHGDNEPIKPLISHIRSLSYSGISTVLVIGGCGEYFDVADKVIMMTAFHPHDATQQAKAISSSFTSAEIVTAAAAAAPPPPAAAAAAAADAHYPRYPAVVPRYPLRVLSSDLMNSKVFVRNRNMIQFGDLELELACVEQIVDPSQTRAIADALRYIESKFIPKDLIGGGGGGGGGGSSGKEGLMCVSDVLHALETLFASPQGLDVLSLENRLMGNYAMPRRYEIAAALNRIRCGAFKQ